MKTIPSRMARRLAAGAFAASSCMALVSISHAQTTNAPSASRSDMRAPMQSDAARDPGMRGEHGMRGMHHMHMMRELGRLKTSLRLTPEQAALWDRAEQRMKPPADMREQMKTRHERMTAMLDDPNFDARKLASEMDSVQSEHMARRKSMREAWFAVYDKLNPVQRGQVREFLRSRMSRGEHMRGRMGWMHHGTDNHQERNAPAAPAPR
ncbi:MAG: Spy/CpxP family protein refolding chaperone [Burkholderiaceae bacterium]